jgi:hypothetical protein
MNSFQFSIYNTFERAFLSGSRGYRTESTSVHAFISLVYRDCAETLYMSVQKDTVTSCDFANILTLKCETRHWNRWLLYPEFLTLGLT